MRPYLAVALFALAALAAACGGGAGAGSSPILPTAAGPSAPPKSAQAKFSLKIPAQARGSSIRRAAYVSPNTQSVQVFASLVGATAPPSPQTFPVTTPSPCTQNPDGSKSCTFNVQAPIGTDNFVVKTFADPSPGPTSSPLAVFESGAVDVANGGTPPTLSFTLTGVIASVDVAMQSPNASVTPSTQISTVGQPIQSSPLGITPRDASGSPILTDTFASPITVTLSPANAGVSFAIANSQCSPASSVSGTTATITCAKDLGALSFSYNGTIARDSSKNVIDRILFAASTSTETGTGSPGYLALAGRVASYPMPQFTTASVSSIRFVKNPDSTFSYLVNQFQSATIGHFDPLNPTNITAVTLPNESWGLTVDHSGNTWVANTSSDAIDCYQSGSSTRSSSISVQTPNSPAPISPYAMTTDTSGNVWFFGYDTGGNEWAGYVGPSVCASAPPFASANVSLSGDFDDAQDAQPRNGGGVFLLSRDTGVYTGDTNTSPFPQVSPMATPPNSAYAQDFAIDGAGNIYGDFSAEGPTFVASLPNGSSAFSTITGLPDTAQPEGISTDGLSPATSFAYGDYSDGDIGVGSASALNHIALFNTGGNNFCYSTFFDANGDAWGACADFTPIVTLTHIIRTSTWSVVVPANLTIFQGETFPIAIIEKGYSGPYTVTFSDPTAATANTPPAGYEDTIPITFNATSAESITMTVKDAHGLAQTFPLSWAYQVSARRHSAARPPRPHHAQGLTTHKRP